MKALGVKSITKVSELPQNIEELGLPIPKPKTKEICIEVYASAINIDDIHIIEGTMFGGIPIGPKPSIKKPVVPGTDVAGIVTEIGPRVTNFRNGQRVYGICNPMKRTGPWAEYCLMEEKNTAIIPESLNFVEAAYFPVSGTVAVNAIDSAGDLKGKRFLVIGASGGTGSVCVQALETLDTTIWAVCSGKNADMVKKLGASKVFDYTQSPFDKQIKELGENVDVVFDFVSGKEIERRALSIQKPKGRFITVVGPEKYVGETKLGFFRLLSMFLYIGWRMLSTKLANTKRYILTGAYSPNFNRINELLIAHQKKVVIDRMVPFEKKQVINGIKHILSHRAKGKVVIQIKE